MRRDGTFTTLHVFGDGDIYGPLIQAFDGNLYSATNTEVFKMSPAGQMTVLSQGCCFQTTLTQGANGSFYGVKNTDVSTFSPGPFTSLHTFSSGDGAPPIFVPIEATDGNLYGMAAFGGTHGYGTIYRLTPSGEFAVLYNFDGANGSNPWQMLMQHTNGLLYGAAGGGKYDKGIFFSLDVGAPPFARLVSTSGTIGKNIGILGQGFTGTTGVSFNGVSATFNVASDTYLETSVPDGALTGSVTVTTPTGTLTSNVPFRVTPKVGIFNPTSGAVGTPVVITGTGLTQTLRVGFGGVAATSFTIDSDTQVTAIVPDGAVTGKIAIATQGGHDTSVRLFTVTP
jgi:uncharacterized repeat protein (TIGR03803 family)